jgi:DNA-binding CsgD family transcriptional regulator
MSDRTYRNTGMYLEFDRPLGVAHELTVCLDAGGPQRTLRLLFTRGRGCDFAQRDIDVLTLLRPHLQVAYFASQRRRREPLPLTRRQNEILHFVAAGYSNYQIGRRLGLSEGTVRKHLENTYSRLGVTSRTAAVARLTPPQPGNTSVEAPS